MHDLCKVNGVIIHTLPIPNHWVNHCRYYYPPIFFSELANLCNYKILYIEIKNAFNPARPRKNEIYVALLKQNNNDFILKKTFKTLKIFDSKYTKYIGNYGKRKSKIWYLWEGFVNKIPVNYIKKIIRTIQCIYIDNFKSNQ